MRTLLQARIIRYLVVGVTSLAVDYATLLVLFHALHLSLPIATTVAFLVGLAINFLLNKYWSFQAQRGFRKSAQQAFLYGLLVAINLIFTNAFIVSLNGLHVGPEITKPIATAIITLWNYILYKTVIFRGKDQEPTV